MKKVAFALLFCLISHSAFAALAIDGSVASTTISSNTASATLTTTNANDVIIIWIRDEQGSTQKVNSISDVAGLTWHTRLVKTNVTTGLINGWDLEEWYATSSGVLTSDVITITFANTATSTRVEAFGISGANTATPFDANGSLPAYVTTAGASNSGTNTISTNNANTMLLTYLVIQTAPTGTRPSGFTQIVAAGTIIDVAYKVVSSAQSSLAIQYTGTTGPPNNNGSALFTDAVQATSSGNSEVGILFGGAP